MKPLSRNVIFFILAVITIGVILSTYNLQDDKPEVIGTSALIEMIEAGEIKSITVVEDTINIVTQDDTELTAKKEIGESFLDIISNNEVDRDLLAGFDLEIKEPSAAVSIARTILPTLFFLGAFLVIFWFVMRGMQGANNKAMTFGQSRAKEASNKKKITFNHVAGSKEAKEELAEIVDFLKHPKKYIEVGAKIPQGVLLMGSPGTGKTLLARAVSGEAGVPFFHISGSEFVEMFVGVGASRVRDLFAKAKKAAPCIIFIDEIDAVGRQRGAGVGGGHDEREQTLNQILVEMDGFEPNSGVIVIAATNRPDVLDPALLRPGRFDRRITLDLPGLKDREEILNIHAKNKPLTDKVDLKRVAERTIGFSGADLMNIMNEAAILAARENKKKTSQENLLEAIEKVMLGPARLSNKLSNNERTITAYHEAGHAIVGHVLPHADEVHKISIISRGRAAGYTMSLPQEDKKMHSRNEFIDEMAMMLGGYAAEQEIFGDITTGPSNDLSRATKLAKRLVTRYGMSKDLGPRTYGQQEEMVFLGKDLHEKRDYSEDTAKLIDKEISQYVEDALKTAKEIIHKHRVDIDKVVKVLLEKETIEKEAFEAIVGPPKKAPKIQLLPAKS